MRFFLPLLLLVFTACTKPHLPEQIQNQEVVVEEPVAIVDHSEKKIKRYIKYYVNQVNKEDSSSILSVDLFSTQLLPKMYKASNFKPLWLDHDNLEDGMIAIQNSVEDGLLPEDYHWNEIDELFNQLIVADTIRFEHLAKLDILLTDGIIFYAFHLLKGKVNPESLDANWNYASKMLPTDALKLFMNAIDKKQVLDELYKFRPDSDHYRALLVENKKLLSSEKDVFSPLEMDERKIEIDEENDIVRDIRQRLISLGDLEPYAIEDSSVYDVTMEEGVRSFQIRHGLYPDGVIGKGTIEMMNMPLEKRTQYLAVNLERLRWIQGEVLDDVVNVNIATFSLELFRNGKVVHRTNVMTGQPYHKTPIFKSKMEYIEFNPTWTVPYSIATNVLLPKLKSDNSYLARNNMELLSRDGRNIDPNNVNFVSYSKSNFPFIIRQKAGKKNALGEVKFIFPNKYSVYLHDTQSKSLFQRTSRAFSHGCIRVESPLELAEAILSDSVKWNRQKIDDVINSRDTKRALLTYDLTVMLQYYTAGLHNSSKVFYYPDVYSRDDDLYKALQEPYNPSTANHQQFDMELEFDSDSSEVILDENAL